MRTESRLGAVLLIGITWLVISTRQNDIDINGIDNLEGTDCQAMSGAEGNCFGLNKCDKHDDVRFALLNNTQTPYFFDSLHDKMACGFPDGPRTLICCESQPIDAPPNKNIPSPPHCGVQATSTTRIVGGTPVTEPGTYPWLAELMYNDTKGKLYWECAGALITSKHVLTAAHCAFPKDRKMYKARIGAISLTDQTDSFWQERIVSSIRQHEDYNQNTKNHDIAIVVLNEPVNLTRFVHPICLPYQLQMREEKFDGKRPFVAGWGRVSSNGATSVRSLLHVQLPVTTNEGCQKVYYDKWKLEIASRQLCVGGDGTHDSCQGDSGSPLMQPIGNYYYVIGIVSFGYYCAVKDYPSINTRVTEYIDWIVKNVST